MEKDTTRNGCTMKGKLYKHTWTFAITGLAGWSLSAPPTSAEFDATIAVDVTTEEAAGFGYRVTDLYATGNVSVGDRLLSTGNAAITGTHDWYQDSSGDSGAGAPNHVLVALPGFEALQYDSYITFNRRTDVDNITRKDPDFDLPAFAGHQVAGGWFWVPGNGQGLAVDIEDVTGNPGQAGVLIARLTLNVGFGGDPCGYSGSLRMFTSVDDGGSPIGVVADVLFECDPCQGIGGNVDLFDFDTFLGCVTGPGANSVDPGCESFDFDCDDDIDLIDWGAFQITFAASG